MKIVEIKKGQTISIKTNPDGSKIIEIDDNKNIRLNDIAPGGVFKIADWDFVVLEHNEQGTAVISKELIVEETKFGPSADCRESFVKDIINCDILPVIESAVGADNIVPSIATLMSLDGQNKYGEVRGKVRLLSFDEVRKWNDLLVNKELDDYWWTLTPWSTKERGWNSIVVCSPSGSVNGSSYYSNRGVRPFCILNSDIYVSQKED